MERRHLLLAAMAAAAGLGAAGAAVLVAGDDDARVAAPAVTVTVARTTVQTATVPATTEASGVPVPPLAGVPLDEATQLLEEAGFDREIDGGGLLGVLDDTAWTVCASTPEAGERVELPATVVVHVDRSCST